MKKNPKIKNMNPIIGGKLRIIREKNNLAVDDFSKLLQVSPKSFKRIENGKTSLGIAQLVFISDSFNIPMDELCSLENFVYEPKDIKSFTPLKNNEKQIITAIVGKNIQKVRMAHNMELGGSEGFAGFLEIPANTLALVEEGIEDISISKLTYLSRILDIPVSALCREDDFDIPDLEEKKLYIAYINEYFDLFSKRGKLEMIYLFRYFAYGC